MLDLYKRSAIDHGLAVREIEKGDAGNAAVYYSIGLRLADKADAIAAGFGATDCTRFGLGSSSVLRIGTTQRSRERSRMREMSTDSAHLGPAEDHDALRAAWSCG